MSRKDRADLFSQLEEIQKKKDVAYLEIKKLININKQTFSVPTIISYFTYSINITHNPTSDTILLGAFHIINLSSKPLLQPIICLKVTTDVPYQLSGKYVNETAPQRMKQSSNWLLLGKSSNTDDYWFKYQRNEPIEPGEKLEFSHFQIDWAAKNSYSLSVYGYVYKDDISDGMESSNTININGESTDEEETNG
ncbi:hypothetical protein HXZ66_13565 [Bacillus sp. A116_S68]|jgi:hypothetical protein|nr:hypothetical protein HXZ66_13565 [Bacillus sp. A116_S68]